jgi:hypothetical protein
MRVRCDRFGLTFQLDTPGAQPQIVPAPIAPMTLRQYLAFLSATVRDANGVTGFLRGALLHDRDEENVPLPPGATFAAHGDDAETEDEVREGAAEFLELGDSAEDTEYRLYHAPKSWQAIRLGPSGPQPRPFAEAEAGVGPVEGANGYAYVTDPDVGLRSQAIMSLAGDLAALLCMGAVTHIRARPESERVFQVFRNWNLDRRRINEWRMLVTGGAWSEKDSPELYDDAMPGGLHQPTNRAQWRAPIHDPGDADLIREAEATANGQGWVPVLRQWLEIYRSAGSDPLDAAAPADGAPSNRAISRAMAYLFDLPNPSTESPAPAPGGGGG